MDATTQKGFQPEAQAKEVSAPVRKRQFLVVSELLFPVETLGDLPSGRFVVEALNGDLKEFETGKIPTAKLLEGIEAGRVYAHWGACVARLDELHPNWAQCAIGRPRRPLAYEHQWPYSERPVRVPAVAMADAETDAIAPAPEHKPVAPVATQGTLL